MDFVSGNTTIFSIFYILNNLSCNSIIAFRYYNWFAEYTSIDDKLQFSFSSCLSKFSIRTSYNIFLYNRDIYILSQISMDLSQICGLIFWLLTFSRAFSIFSIYCLFFIELQLLKLGNSLGNLLILAV